MRREIATDGREALTQFLPVASVASIAKTAEPLKTVRLTDDGASPHDLPALAPPVARSTDVIQPAKGRGQGFCLGQGALPGRLTRPIDVKDYPGASCSIHQASGLLLRHKRATEQIVEKEHT